MKRLILIIALLTVGCNNDKSKEVKKETTNLYIGEVQPCIDYNDKLWCKEAKQLNSEANITLTIKKDKENNYIVVEE